MARWRLLSTLWAVLLLAGCGRRDMSVLDAAGPQAAQIAGLWWLFFWITIMAYGVTLAFFMNAIFRRKRPNDPESKPRQSRAAISVGVAVGLTVILLFVLLFSSVTTGHSLASLSSKNATTIEITGRQWWWQARYLDPVAGKIVITANEIHVPVGEPVVLLGTSRDVIHSFWAPNI